MIITKLILLTLPFIVMGENCNYRSKTYLGAKGPLTKFNITKAFNGTTDINVVYFSQQVNCYRENVTCSNRTLNVPTNKSDCLRNALITWGIQSFSAEYWRIPNFIVLKALGQTLFLIPQD